MALLSLDDVKKHLRVLHDDEDAEIAIYQAAAENIVVQHLDRIVVAEGVELPADGEDGYDPYTMVITPAITAAILLTIGDLFENREADAKSNGEAMLPRYVRALIAPWRVWRMVDCETA
ncbi:head-tail connector protein [Ferirhizobium litorale]|uniref:Head-tail connector protein n=1 Tax=Ferirhizobium litorale TaxID=2927786 RepID=A0AAE3U4V1_9HYPH|nr:head-tail connector protein [Fererhizobium litorale]MDI7923399.1 head-tail connector protein [Fererhizobium litorale]